MIRKQTKRSSVVGSKQFKLILGLICGCFLFVCLLFSSTLVSSGVSRYGIVNVFHRQGFVGNTSKVFLGFQKNRTGFNGTLFLDEMTQVDESLVEELVFRRNTKYWLESKPSWPKDPIPITNKYVTFSEWKGGFNNVRMSLEMAVAFAVATNRTLVLPPEKNFFLFNKFDFADAFEYEDLRRGLPVIKYDEFIAREKLSKLFSMPKEKRLTGFEFLSNLPASTVYDTKLEWGKKHGGTMVFCVPNCPKPDPGNQSRQSEYLYFSKFSEHLTPKNIDSKLIEDAKIVHFDENLLGQFYGFIYFRDPSLQYHLKKVVRNHVHLRDHLVGLAERIIEKLGDLKYNCLHVRRNDNQFSETMIPAEQIVDNIGELLKTGEPIYISTDELGSVKNASKIRQSSEFRTHSEHMWFQPMFEAWGHENVSFLSDYLDLFGSDIDSSLFGIIEMLVCTRARLFVGTRKSTFSGYINRMRGYMRDIAQEIVYEAQLRYPDDYYDILEGPQWSKLSHKYGSLGHPYWGLEYLESHEGLIDV